MLVLTIDKYLSELNGVDEWLMTRGQCVTSVWVASKMTQPWAFIAGNTLSTIAGISISQLFTRPLGHAGCCDVVYLGDVYPALPTSTCSCSGFDCGLEPNDEVSLCLFPSVYRLGIPDFGRGLFIAILREKATQTAQNSLKIWFFAYFTLDAAIDTMQSLMP